MLIRPGLLLAGLFLPLLAATGAEAACEFRMKLYLAAKQECAATGAYCGDVPLYKEDVIRDCGAAALAEADGDAPEGGGAPSSEGQTSFNRDMPDLDNGLPRSCAYLTRPSYEDVRLNYHLPGAMLCHSGRAYECQSVDDVKDWVYRAPCDVFQGIEQACAVEGTC